MVFLLAILLPLYSQLAHATLASEMSLLLQQRDWPGLVLLLKPKEGQNFDHDVVLSKAYLQLERRLEAQKLLKKWLDGKHDEFIQKQLDLTSNLFFNQETSDLYFDAVRLISIRKWSEAKTLLDQAIAKEPGNILLISRLVEVALQLNLKEIANEQLKVGLDLNPHQKELEVFSARLLIDDEEAKEAQRTLLSQKSWIFDHELPTLWYFESLELSKRSSEVLMMQKGVLKLHPHWGELRYWLLKNGLVAPEQSRTLKLEIDELLKDADKYSQMQESEYRKGQYYWMSNKTVEALKLAYGELLKKEQGPNVIVAPSVHLPDE